MLRIGRISAPRFLTEFRKRRLIQGSLGSSQIPLGSSRHVRRVVHVVTSVSSRARSNMADDEEGVWCSRVQVQVFRALDLRQFQEQLTEKLDGHVHPDPRCGDALKHVL